MGINGLTKLLQKEAPTSILTTNLHTIRGKTVAVDASLFIYKMVCSFSQNNDMRHVTGLYWKILIILILVSNPSIYLMENLHKKRMMY